MGLIYLFDGGKTAGLNEVPQLPSCTSVPQQWGRPRGPKIEAEPVAAISFASSDKSSRKRRAVQPLLQDNRYYYLTSESSLATAKYNDVYKFCFDYTLRKPLFNSEQVHCSLLSGNYMEPVICLCQ